MSSDENWDYSPYRMQFSPKVTKAKRVKLKMAKSEIAKRRESYRRWCDNIRRGKFKPKLTSVLEEQQNVIFDPDADAHINPIDRKRRR